MEVIIVKKRSLEDIKKKAESIGYELLSKNYINNNIKLIRIPYYDFNNIEEIINQNVL